MAEPQTFPHLFGLFVRCTGFIGLFYGAWSAEYGVMLGRENDIGHAMASGAFLAIAGGFFLRCAPIFVRFAYPNEELIQQPDQPVDTQR